MLGVRLLQETFLFKHFKNFYIISEIFQWRKRIHFGAETCRAVFTFFISECVSKAKWEHQAFAGTTSLLGCLILQKAPVTGVITGSMVSCSLLWEPVTSTDSHLSLAEPVYIWASISYSSLILLAMKYTLLNILLGYSLVEKTIPTFQKLKVLTLESLSPSLTCLVGLMWHTLAILICSSCWLTSMYSTCWSYLKSWTRESLFSQFCVSCQCWSSSKGALSGSEVGEIRLLEARRVAVRLCKQL